MKRIVLYGALVFVAAGVAVLAAARLGGEPSFNFRVDKVRRGTLQPTIGATGTVAPEDVIDVGAQVSGRIEKFGSDRASSLAAATGRLLCAASARAAAAGGFAGASGQLGAAATASVDFTPGTVDYRSVVREGDVLAEIDQTSYLTKLAQAKANLARAQADKLQLVAKFNQAKRDWERAQRLAPANAIAQTDFDLYKANYEAAEASVKVGQAAIEQSQAALDSDQTNLNYTVIKSPVNGVIIDRRVNVGQTVVSNMNVSSMFLIAKDLKRMQVWAQVNEADLGQVHEGMPVEFTVDTFPGETFRGTVAQIRLNAQFTQNVVIYTVVIATDNNSLRLWPYFTANVRFQLPEHANVLVVPNAALRWAAKLEHVAPDAREEYQTAKKRDEAARRAKGGGRGQASPGAKAGGGPAAAARPASSTQKKPSRETEERGRLWVLDGAYVRPLDVRVGVSDGIDTEVSGEGVVEGLEIVKGEEVTGNNDGGANNPFTPKFFRGGRRF